MNKIMNIKLIGLVFIISILFSSCGIGKMSNTKKTISKLENKEYYQKYLPKKNINEEVYGYPIISRAANMPDIDLVRACLKDGADPNIKYVGYSPLEEAVWGYLQTGKNEYLDIIDLLLEHNASPKTDKIDALQILFKELHAARNHCESMRDGYNWIDERLYVCEEVLAHLLPYCRNNEYFTSGTETYVADLSFRLEHNSSGEWYRSETTDYLQLEGCQVIYLLLENGYKLSLKDLNYIIEEGYLNPNETNHEFYYTLIKEYCLRDEYKNMFVNDNLQTLLTSLYYNDKRLEQRIELIKFLAENGYVLSYTQENEKGKSIFFTPMELVNKFSGTFSKENQSLKDFIIWCHEKDIDLNKLYQSQDGETSLDSLCNKICDEANRFDYKRNDKKLVSLIDAFNTIVSYGYTEMGNYRFYGYKYKSVEEFYKMLNEQPFIRELLATNGVVLVK